MAHYVNNKELYSVIVEYKKQVAEAEAAGLPKPRIPDYVGKAILLIANRVSTKPNFINYSYREEMISDGIENCVSYFDNFDPEKSTNPFAYLTQIISYAFIRRIQKEKKQQYIRYKAMEDSIVFNETFEQSGNDFDEEIQIYTADIAYDNAPEFIRSFEKTLEEKRVKREKKGLELFFDNDDEESDKDDVEER